MRKVKPQARRRLVRSVVMARKPSRRRGAAIAAIFLVLLGGACAVFAFELGRTKIALESFDSGLRGLLVNAGLSVRAITVTGREHTGREELLKALSVSRGSPILPLDLGAAQQRIAALPWVRVARLSRSLPDTIRVELIERRPVAIWQRGGEMVLVDSEGVEITTKSLPEYAQLPLIVGKGAPQAAQELFVLLASEPRLQARIAAAIRVGGRRWNLRFHDGIDVRLPEQAPLAAWRKLAQYEQAKGLFARDIEIVDLRHPDRVVVRLTHGAVRRITLPEQEARVKFKLWQAG